MITIGLIDWRIGRILVYVDIVAHKLFIILQIPLLCCVIVSQGFRYEDDKNDYKLY